MIFVVIVFFEEGSILKLLLWFERGIFEFGDDGKVKIVRSYYFLKI